MIPGMGAKRYDAIVAGVGGFGSAALYHLARRGRRVLGIERFDVPALVSYVSQVIALEPGDLILTGTPEGVGVFREPKITLKDGDVVEIEVEGIGVLRNEVQA